MSFIIFCIIVIGLVLPNRGTYGSSGQFPYIKGVIRQFQLTTSLTFLTSIEFYCEKLSFIVNKGNKLIPQKRTEKMVGITGFD